MLTYLVTGAVVGVVVFLVMLLLGPGCLDFRGYAEALLLALICGAAWPGTVVVAVVGAFMYGMVHIWPKA